MKHSKFIVCLCVSTLFLVFPLCSAQAAFQFNVFTKETPYWSNLNLYMVVSDAGSNKVDFTFHNASSIASSIARIYFDDGSLLGIAQILEGPGTAFSENPKPSNLPAAEMLTPPFEAVKEFGIGADPPPSSDGANPGEWVTIRFDLKTSGSYQSVLDELGDGTLRVGLHIIGLPSGSESAVNVPEPVTMCLLGLGAFALRRRK
jgi:hypothetical protein